MENANREILCQKNLKGVEDLKSALTSDVEMQRCSLPRWFCFLVSLVFPCHVPFSAFCNGNAHIELLFVGSKRSACLFLFNKGL